MATRWPAGLWLVRHGESEGNVADRQAHERGAGRIDLPSRDADVALSATGRGQAQALGRRLAEMPPEERPTAVLSSPYERAAATAGTAVAASGFELDVRCDERLRERELGMFDGFTGLGIREEFPEEAERRRVIGKFYYRPPGGESWCDVALRVRSVVSTLREEYAGQRVLITSHQAVIMVFRYVLEGLSEADVLELDRREQVRNCALTWYQQRDDGLELAGFNSADHLVERGKPVTEEPDAEEDAENGDSQSDARSVRA